MDKILSARIDESVLSRLSYLAKSLNKTKKEILEKAIGFYASKYKGREAKTAFDESFGSWKRKESGGRTIKQARHAFNQAMHRYSE